jgi:hypothetical protein
MGKTVKVVGHDEPIPSYRVGDDVVRVGRWYYFRGDPKIVQVRTECGTWGSWKTTYLKHNSPNVVRSPDGYLYHKDFCVKIEHSDGQMEHKDSGLITRWQVDGKYYFNDAVVMINQSYVPLYDEQIVRLSSTSRYSQTSGGWAYKKDCIRLSDYFYPIRDKLYYVSDDHALRGDRFNSVWLKKTDLLYQLERRESLPDWARDMSPMERENPGRGSNPKDVNDFWDNRRPETCLFVEVYRSEDNYTTKHVIKDTEAQHHFHQEEGIWRHRLLSRKDSIFRNCIYYKYPVLYDILDGNIYEDRYLAKTAHIFDADVTNNPDDFEICDKHEVVCFKPVMTKEELEERYLEDRYEYLTGSIDEAKEHVSKNYAENGPDENQAQIIDVNYIRPRGGREIIDFREKIIKSPSSKRFGSIRYTFGVEIETSYGRIPDEELRDNKLAIVSDGSIRAGEYVTSPLHGDLGFRNLKSMMDLISTYCLVSNEGAGHVHIGGAMFNRRFSILAIMAGCQIEEEMFMMQPPTKDPRNKYCSGISKDWGESPIDGHRWSRDYSHISFNNWKEVLGQYVFGTTFGRGMNSLHDVPRWNKYRHKWLNLVNCNSVGRFDTIEFRIFGVTTSFDKMYSYVLISMAIVWFIENKQGRIIECHKEFVASREGLTLKEIVTSAYSTREDISERLITFIEARKQKFNRNL